ncbi:hypothetical protein [Adhaeribacter rhizoryzae]|uniref:DUF4254 domain-containing protein n=1 Tax=Adhaeribacter rhizoryzae TaxID=2607907 RepID=A0A5M6CYR3_9BACT|nr:hypothetical protein [Adhaeribacter rhizoryzae]KAA5539142.1 hypothetical protein F0145_25065 [Adhaeribacter rhizoryzae]
MRKHLLISWLLVFLFAEGTAQAPAAVPVTSPNTRYQLEREVMTRWNRFNPRWYFILFHNQYRTGPDRRNLKQLLPLLAVTKINLANTEQEDKDVTDIRDQELFKMADRSLNKSWHLLYENKVKTLNNRIALLNAEAITAGVDFDMLLALKGEQERINGDITLIKESYEADAKKAERFRIALEDLTVLRGYYLRIITLFKTSKTLPQK